MKKNWIDVLLELPVDEALREFLTDNGLSMPAAFAWTDGPDTSDALIKAVRDWPDGAVRDRLTAKLSASVQLGDAAGKQAMFQVAAGTAAAFCGLVACQSDVHRSFWLAVKHPDLFERAGDVDYFERHGAQAQQHALGIRRRPDTGDTALTGLRQAVSAFYQRELLCGDRCKAYLVERSPGVFLLSVHVKDLATLQPEFEGDDLTRRVGNPNIHSVMEYSMATGVTRSLVKGGAKYHQMLLDAFAKHLLGETVEARRLTPPTLDLSILRLGFEVPQAIADGFIALQVKSLTLLSPDHALKIECTAMAASDQQCVTALLRRQLFDTFANHWLVTAARINLYYPPAPGKRRQKPVTIEVTRKGRLNLLTFDPALQAQLEGYLVTLGILAPGQRLYAQEGWLDGEVSEHEPASLA